MAHIHILVQPTSFWWPHYFSRPKWNTTRCSDFNSGIQIVEKGAEDVKNFFPHELNHEQLHEQQMGC